MTDLSERIDAAVDEHLGSEPGAIVNPGLSRVLKKILKDVLAVSQGDTTPVEAINDLEDAAGLRQQGNA